MSAAERTPLFVKHAAPVRVDVQRVGVDDLVFPAVSQKLELFLDLCGLVEVVGIEKADVFTAASPDRVIPSVSLPGVELVNVDDPGITDALQYTPCCVRGAIVNDEDLEVLIGLPDGTPQGTLDVSFGVVCRGND